MIAKYRCSHQSPIQKQVFALLIFQIIGLLLASCSTSAASQLTPDVSSTIAARAQTIVVELNQTGTASVPITMTPLLTLTPLPTSLPPTMSATASPTYYSSAVGCNSFKVISVSPSATDPLAAGQNFTQSWQIENNGTCSWDQSYQLTFVSGERLGASPGRLNQVVSPGKSITLSLAFIAPNQGGAYISVWRFSDAQGTPFGETLSVSIAVRNNSESTPYPEQPIPAQTTAYVQTVVADLATANAIGRETAEAQMTSSYETAISSMYGTITAAAATNAALLLATPQP